MIDWFRAWSKNIVIAVVIATIIEMILPDNNSKKYIKIVIGIFIVYTIISPIIDQFFGKSVNDIAEFQNCIETSSNSASINEDFSEKTSTSVRAIYSKNLQNDINNKLKDKGYVAGNIFVEIAKDDSYNIEKVDVTITEKLNNGNTEKQAKTIVDTIKYVVIKIDNKEEKNEIIDENDKDIIRKLIRENYGVQDSNISVN